MARGRRIALVGAAILAACFAVFCDDYAGVDPTPVEDAGTGDGGVEAQGADADAEAAPGFDLGCGAAGLVAAWMFDEDAGDAVDCTGHGFSARLLGDAGRAPARDGGRAFDVRNTTGGTDYARPVNDSALNFGGPFSLTAWVLYRDALRNGRIVSTSSPTVDPGFELTWEGGFGGPKQNYLSFKIPYMFDGGVPFYVSTDTRGNLLPNEWHHVAAVYDGTTGAIYLDGILEEQKPSPPRRVSLQPFYFGRRADTTVSCFNDGLVDDLRVYNRAVPADEIRALAAR